jgi:nucleotide-binding universal stress UspA family protein
VTIAVAHQAASSARSLALQAAAHEASVRGTQLAVLHVVESLDLDVRDAYENGLRDEIEAVLRGTSAQNVPWKLYLATAPDDVATTILRLADEAAATMLVIGARRRSPVGKALLGSVTQTLVLNAEMPVLVVKGERIRH